MTDDVHRTMLEQGLLDPTTPRMTESIPEEEEEHADAFSSLLET
ncbi:hypothetical protein [Streptomyces camelliae]|uniref:Uncharacterized protein n=1 Tax=Streptomyces camelliae TaxID=3004093 RepID=A0ABY7NX49_9ACTN|nr:hypothetical protein [Streptomyces sp. HUAS 2-6]WBO61834.1 hypothetical protein O1G22_02745 [Streptomyces sp. HUAS 2-6]